MAVDSASVSKHVASGKERIKSPQKKELKSQGSSLPASPAKRNTCPGIRVVGGRIYDSFNGKTCHQAERFNGVDEYPLHLKAQAVRECRQKTRDFAASCTNQGNNKPCTLMLCHKCLLNRYGEKAEEVAALKSWNCPRCRGICNCSVCMKKKGQQPTGILITTAKATGFSSVSEMLLKGTLQFNSKIIVPDMAISPKKGVSVSPGNRGKENSLDGKLDANLQDPVDNKSVKAEEEGREKRKLKQEKVEGIGGKKRSVGETEESVKKSKKMKLANSHELNNRSTDKMTKVTSVHSHHMKPKKSKLVGLEEKDNFKKNDVMLARRTSPRKSKITDNYKISSVGEPQESGSHDLVKKSKKMKLAGLPEMDDENNDEMSKSMSLETGNNEKNDVILARRTSPRKLKISDKMPNEPEFNIEINSEDKVNERKDEDTDNPNCETILQHHSVNFHVAFTFPLGIELASVAGIGVCAEDVGNALQFLEFFAVFGEVLGIKKGRAENVLRDMLHGRAGRRGKLSATAQFHVELLHIILREQGQECSTCCLSYGESYWFNALKKCLSGYQAILETEKLDLDKTTDYEMLDGSVKLRILNLLCDELLETEMLRTWIAEQNTMFAEKFKEASKQKALAAKGKEKSLKQKLKDNIAKGIIAKQGANLSISEHEAIVSHIKSEAAKAHAKMLESEGMATTDNHSCAALRIDPIFLSCGGHAYWKLNYSGKFDILRQDVGKGDLLTLDDKWFTIDVEGKKVIESIFYLSGGRA